MDKDDEILVRLLLKQNHIEHTKDKDAPGIVDCTLDYGNGYGG